MRISSRNFIEDTRRATYGWDAGVDRLRKRMLSLPFVVLKLVVLTIMSQVESALLENQNNIESDTLESELEKNFSTEEGEDSDSPEDSPEDEVGWQETNTSPKKKSPERKSHCCHRVRVVGADALTARPLAFIL